MLFLSKKKFICFSEEILEKFEESKRQIISVRQDIENTRSLLTEVNQKLNTLDEL